MRASIRTTHQPSNQSTSDCSGRSCASVWWHVQIAPAFIVVAAVAAVGCPLAMQFDHHISTSLRQLDLAGDIQKAISLSEAFAHGFGVLIILLAIFAIAVNRRRALLVATLITVLSGITANALKATVVRIRPHADGLQVIGPDEVGLDVTTGVERSYWDARQRSFPSGHAATAWGLAIGLSLIFWRGWWIFAMLAMLASVQRIESGAHYPSDVLAGAAIAFLIAACVLASRSLRSQLLATYT